jgi:hypothetical protein
MAEGEWGPTGPDGLPMGWTAHYGGLSAQALVWCPLPSRVVFRSFRGLNHMLSSFACLECMIVVPGLFCG